MKLDFIRVQNNVLIHKQLEKRDGRTYMRMRKFPVCQVDAETVC